MTAKNTDFYTKQFLNCGGKLLDLSTPQVMGILNVTPDSFYDGGRLNDLDTLVKKGEEMLKAGAVILDVGGMSSRPGADVITPDEELKRVLPAIEALKKAFPEVIISIDTVHARVAEEAVKAGAAIINDISAGSMDEQMFPTVARLNVPYVLMHMQGRPNTMQQAPHYEDVVTEVLDFLITRLHELRTMGVHDVIIDQGYGFGKTVEHNYQLLKATDRFTMLGQPLLVGVSRKSMICKVLKKDPKDALNGTTALHAIALLKGASMLRVHDVQEAIEVVKLMEAYKGA